MKNYLIFDCVNSDRLFLNAGQTIHAGESFRLFTTEDGDNIQDKVTEQSEEQILQWLLSSSGGSLLLDKL